MNYRRIQICTKFYKSFTNLKADQYYDILSILIVGQLCNIFDPPGSNPPPQPKSPFQAVASGTGWSGQTLLLQMQDHSTKSRNIVAQKHFFHRKLCLDDNQYSS